MYKLGAQYQKVTDRRYRVPRRHRRNFAWDK